MPITLSDEQVAQLRAFQAEAQRNKEIADFTNGIWNDPTLSDEAKALAKKKYPDLAIPDFDLKRSVDARFTKEREDREKIERDKAEKEASDRFAAQRKSVQKEYGFTDDAMERMEKEMNERRVYDYEAMAPYFASKEPKPTENTSGHFWNYSKQDKFKEIAADPEDYALNELTNAIRADDQRRRSMR